METNIGMSISFFKDITAVIDTRIVKKAMTFGIRHLTQEIDYFLGKGFSKPDLVEINLTRRCNAKCRMCDFWKTTDREENEVHADKWINREYAC